ncbi:MAG: alcohol dehydrogenase catalytic domain-containing protein [Candidatus Bathyarchaeia archaeon]
MPRNAIPDNMKAAILEAPFTIKLKSIPTPKPKIDEVLIKVAACGICGSDVRYFMGENPWSMHTLGIEEPIPPNTILGHEVSGFIVDVGSLDFEDMIGSRVGVIAFKSCGRCYYCLKSLHNICGDMLHIGHDGRWKDRDYIPGGYAEYMPLWWDKAHPIPDNISFEEATQLDGLAVAVHAVGRAGVKSGDTVAVVGVGPIGLMILQVARAMGACKIVALDVRGKPLEIAENLGADSAVDVSKIGIDDSLIRETEGIGANAIFDTVCSESTVTHCLRSLARGGRLILVALNRLDIKLNLLDLSGERIITSSSNNLYHEYTAAVNLLSSGRVQVKPFITHIFKLDEIEEAFHVAIHKEEYEAIKVVLKP